MNYDLSPFITRITPFNSQGGALAAVDINFGPVMVRAKLYQNATGYFLSWPSRKSEASDRWFDQVVITDASLKVKAIDAAVSQYKSLAEGELIAI